MDIAGAVRSTCSVGLHAQLGRSMVGIRGDRSRKPGDADRLGFRKLAENIALALVDHGSDDGLVVGLEGVWGSGKTSLLAYIQEALDGLPESQRPTTIHFRPWLVGNRDALLADLFGSLKAKIDWLALDGGDAGPIVATKAKKASDAIRKFIASISAAGDAIALLGESIKSPKVTTFGRLLAILEKPSKATSSKPSLEQLKREIIIALRELGRRIIITIDDVDRLEPSEAVEVLRLARSVADFPNVIYLLCYDRSILAHSIEKALKVKSGRAYLEKIVQLTLMVPLPEEFQLREWFSEELNAIASAGGADAISRLKVVVDYEGGRQLRTPRSVVRTLDAIRFLWPPLEEVGADLADLVWLQLIKNGNPRLYSWIERYCKTAASLALGTCSVDESERDTEGALLKKSASAQNFDVRSYRYFFAEQLFGLEVDFASEDGQFLLHQQVADKDRDLAIRERRLASPDHYRLYFALSAPSHALATEDFGGLRSTSATGAIEVENAFLQWQASMASGSLTKLDILLERIKGGLFEQFSSIQCRNILVALSNSMDSAYHVRPFGSFAVNTIWDRAERAIPPLLSQLSDEQRTATIDQMFKAGNAIGWLTSLFRRETFAHGRIGSSSRHQDDWLFSDGELDNITELMLPRYRAMSPSAVLDSIDPLNLLFAWLQAGDEDGPRQVIQQSIKSDEQLVTTLEKLTSTIASSDRGQYSVLKRNQLEPFLDFDRVRERIRALLARPDEVALSKRAAVLDIAFDDGMKF
jgi:predicted KAP-like P-loop ATPase